MQQAIANLAKKLNDGVDRQRQGDLAGAEEIYREILNDRPNEPNAMHLLGVVHLQRGENDVAIGLITRAIEGNPGASDFYSNLGAAQFAVSDYEAAEESFRKAIELGTTNAETYGNLAAVCKRGRRFEEAIDCYREALKIAPERPKFLRGLGESCLSSRRFREAVAPFQRLAELRPDDAATYNSLGYAYQHVDDARSAYKCFLRAYELRPDWPEVIANVGTSLNRMGRKAEAEEFFLKARDATPTNWRGLANQAQICVKLNQFEQAYEIFEKLIEMKPDKASLYNDYGVALSMDGRAPEAEAAFKRAVEIKPDFVEAYGNLAGALMQVGKTDEGIEAYRTTMKLDRTYVSAYINLLSYLIKENRLDEAYLYANLLVHHENFHLSIATNPLKVFGAVCDFAAIEALGDPWEIVRLCRERDPGSTFLMALALAETPEEVEELVQVHKEWGKDVSRIENREPLPPAPPRSRHSKIRIGLMSADLRAHSVAKFVRPLVNNLDRDRFEIHCFSPTRYPEDLVQQHFISVVDAFNFMENVSIRDIAAKIRESEIDILFDLQGFTSDAKLKVFAHRPAPIQVSWLGYPFTSGIPEVDYILLDHFNRPEKDEWLVEKPLIMDKSWVCFGDFGPSAITPEPPMLRNGYVTFGTMNNPYKFTPRMLDVWAGILNRVPDSRLLVVRPECRSMMLIQKFTEFFEQRGVSRERLHFVDNKTTTLPHFEFYNEMDITLDTYPVTGGTTTCDAMWMGVPVVALKGPSFHHRVCYSLLMNGGMGDLCADSYEEYADIACALAGEPDLLAQVRQTQRQTLKDSPLCDAEGFTENFQRLMTQIAEEKGLI